MSSYTCDFSNAPKAFNRVMKAAFRTGAMTDPNQSLKPSAYSSTNATTNTGSTTGNTAGIKKTDMKKILEIRKGESIKDFNRYFQSIYSAII